MRFCESRLVEDICAPVHLTKRSATDMRKVVAIKNNLRFKSGFASFALRDLAIYKALVLSSRRFRSCGLSNEILCTINISLCSPTV